VGAVRRHVTGKYYEFPIYQGITGAILFTTLSALD
jgi:hypothetical protein